MRKRLNILITAQFDEEGLETLRRYGEVTYSCFGDESRVLAGQKLVQALQGVHILVTEVDQVKRYVLAKTPDLKVIASCRGDPVNIDVAAATERGIPVLRAPGRNADAVADLTLLFMLALLRHFLPVAAILRQPGDGMEKLARAFFEYKGVELWEKTVGLIGLGAVGQRVAKRLQAFGAHVVAYDPYVPAHQAHQIGVSLVSLDALLATSDIVSLHTVVTDETAGMFGEREFRLMKKGAYFVNTARAALTDEGALYRALRDGHLAGAALDVFADEPPSPNHPLLTLPNVIATPHIGGNTREVVIHQTRLVVADLVRLFEGQRPENIVNPEVLEHFRWP
ncbi:MAG: 3-phosphoglycerate dehydrogenase [Chloroflexi bacterium]|nr:3-phosphoglycerate dehydrogenase [Chloroflexota bacterium]